MFEGIYGHSAQKEMLIEAITNDRISHAYLFYGTEGIGKQKIAKEFARRILGVDNLDTCVDYKYISKKEDKKDIVAQQIREDISDDVIEKPISCKRKVYIINDANFLNDIAQNALLKTLEEPPTYIVIILIASNISMLLPTILSRLTKVEFSKIDKENMDKYVRDNNIVLQDNIIEFAEGSIGKMNNIISEKLVDNFSKIDEIICCFEQKDIANAMIKCGDIDFNNVENLDYLEFMLFKKKHYVAALEVKTALKRLKMNGNYDIVIDNMIIKCIERL